MNKKILVAGIGNVFFGDGGFGPAVAVALRDRTWPHGVEIIDFGVRGIDLAHALTRGLDAVILVDAMARGGKPGTLYVVEPEPMRTPGSRTPHKLDPTAVLQLAATFGDPPPYVRLVGCEPGALPASNDEIAHGLSPHVEAAVAQATQVVARLVREVQCAS
jgi:hydrogenase maturation protease